MVYRNYSKLFVLTNLKTFGEVNGLEIDGGGVYHHFRKNENYKRLVEVRKTGFFKCEQITLITGMKKISLRIAHV